MSSSPILELPRDGRQSERALTIARGTRRLLRAHGLSTLTELTLPSGRRADIIGIGADGAITIVEVKSSIADFRADQKWPDYRDHCDHLFFAISTEIPPETMPADTGLIVADSYGADILRAAPLHKLAPATRRAMLLRFGLQAADRLHLLWDRDCGMGQTL